MTQEEELEYMIKVLKKMIEHLQTNSTNKELIAKKIKELRDCKIDLILSDRK